MNEVLDKSSSLKSTSNLMNSSKIKFSDKVTTSAPVNGKNLNTSNMSKSGQQSVKSQKLLNNSNLPPHNTSSLGNTRTMKKPILEYNGVGDHPIESEKNTLYSTWTPLSDEQTNYKLFDERKQLVNKWFENWNDKQRKLVLDELLVACKPRQLVHARDTLNQIAPIYHHDFTRILPRVLSLYIFSFLDPRSLSRCAQVCWYWKTLTELDILWMPKCLRFNWILNYKPTPFETGIWKRYYIENIKAIQFVPTREVVSPLNTERSEMTIEDLKKGKFNWNSSFNRSKINFKTLNGDISIEKRPPWKGNQFNPNQLYRYNYLEAEKEDVLEKRRNHLIKTLQLDSSIARPSSASIKKKPNNKTTVILKNNKDELNTSANLNSKVGSTLNTSQLQQSNTKIHQQNSLNKNNSTLNSSSRPESSSTFVDQNKKPAWKLLSGSDDDI